MSKRQAPTPMEMHRQQKQQHNLLNSNILAPLLHHPRVINNQQVLLRLLASCKGLQAAIIAACPAQLEAVVSPADPEQLRSFALWVRQHGSLLRGLKVKLKSRPSNGSDNSSRPAWSEAVRQLVASLQLACRSTLQHLQLLSTGRDAALPMASAAVLAPLASLQQLSVLQLEQLYPNQLPRLLPLQLQQLDLTLQLSDGASMLELLGYWWGVHGPTVRSLELQGGQKDFDPVTEWGHAVECFASAMAAADVFTDDVPAAPCSPAAAAVESRLQLQSLVTVFIGQTKAGWECSLGPVLQHLPASRLTRLECRINFGNAAHVAAVGRLTALRRLALLSEFKDSNHMDGEACLHGTDVLLPLAQLKQLTSFELGVVQCKQLQHLPPQLEWLDAWLDDEQGFQQAVEQEQQQAAGQLQLGHLSRLVGLVNTGDLDYRALRAGDVLPPNLQTLTWETCSSVQPLLRLQNLQTIRLAFYERCYEGWEGASPTAEEVQQLSSLQRLQEVQLMFDGLCSTATLAAWSKLPVVHLQILFADDDVVLSSSLLQQLGTFTGLKLLQVYGSLQPAAHLEATPGQLAAVLQSLRQLEELNIGGFASMGDAAGCVGTTASSSASRQTAKGAAKLLFVLANGLPTVNVVLPANLTSEELFTVKAGGGWLSLAADDAVYVMEGKLFVSLRPLSDE